VAKLTDQKDVQLVEKLNNSISDVKKEIGKVIVGQHEIIDSLLVEY